MSTLSLCVICKNEEKNIGTLLDSIKGDLFDEIIICDTGSTDGTIDILKKYGVKIEHFKWINDFSAARNYAFSKATSDYIMWMDSDDILKPVDYQKFLDLKKHLDEAPMWVAKYAISFDEKGNSTYSFYRERIVKRSLGLKWQEPIHEYILLYRGYRKVDIEITHNSKEEHTSRNVSMLEAIVAKDPDNSRNVYYLGKEYFDNGDYDKALPILERFIDMKDAWGDDVFGALIRLGTHQMESKNFSAAKKYLYRAIEQDPLRAKAYYHLGNCFLWDNDPHTAIHWFKVCCTMDGNSSGNSLGAVEPKFYTWGPNLQLCVAYDKIGETKKAAEHNEIALSYQPNNQIMIENKEYFKKKLGQ